MEAAVEQRQLAVGALLPVRAQLSLPAAVRVDHLDVLVERLSTVQAAQVLELRHLDTSCVCSWHIALGGRPLQWRRRARHSGYYKLGIPIA